MDEWSRIVLEEYCATHKSAKSRRIGKLVEMTYDMFCEPTDSDAIFLEKAIDQETDEERKNALIDLNDFLFQ